MGLSPTWGQCYREMPSGIPPFNYPLKLSLPRLKFLCRKPPLRLAGGERVKPKRKSPPPKCSLLSPLFYYLAKLSLNPPKSSTEIKNPKLWKVKLNGWSLNGYTGLIPKFVATKKMKSKQEHQRLYWGKKLRISTFFCHKSSFFFFTLLVHRCMMLLGVVLVAPCDCGWWMIMNCCYWFLGW